MTPNVSTADADDAASLTQRIVEKTTDVAGADPLDLPPLYSAIDPDALETLCGRDGDDGPRVEFSYAGCGVTIRGDGTVNVTPEPIGAAETTPEESASLSPDC